ncbi:pentapeptide repeat-containing protein [bacterium]|nr:MAG: pentapeptide repeat-containing protein [bacterium]
MTKKALPTPAPPRLNADRLEEASLADIELLDEVDLHDLKLSGVAIGDATSGRFARLSWQGARLGAVSWRRAQFEDTVFEKCDFANADGRELYLSRVVIEGCRGVGFKAAECNWRDVVCREGNWSLAQFRYAKFERVRFENLDLREADFQNADLRGATFRDCDLREAQFSFARLQGADFRTCQTEDIRIDAGALNGLNVSPLQAAQFATILGLKVQWSDGDLT